MTGADEAVSAIREMIDGEHHPADGIAGLLRRLCRLASGGLAATGVGVSVLTDDGGRGLGAGSDPVSEKIEDLQYVLGEGPGLDAFAARRPVFAIDLTGPAGRQWPVYAQSVQAYGIRAVHAFPLQVGGARLGIMDVFRDHTAPLAPTELTAAFDIADLVLATLLDHHEKGSRGAGAGLSGDDLLNRAHLFQAQGMVMVQLGVPLAEAMVRMRAYAYAQNRRLEDIAQDVVNRTLRFDPDPDPGSIRGGL